MMTVEYAPHGLIGVLTPQANTTVEPEFWVMLPPGVAMINARMMSDQDTLEGRLLDYFEQLDTAVRQFHNAPIGAIALGTTGASYVAGIPRERDAVAALTKKTGVPFVTAGLAVVLALNTLKARRIGIVSPYPEPLDQDLHSAIGRSTASRSTASCRSPTVPMSSIRSIRSRRPMRSRGSTSSRT